MRSPDHCRMPLCGYLEQRPGHDQCRHTGVRMQDGCAWHRTPEQIRAIEAQEQMTAQRIAAPLGKRGL